MIGLRASLEILGIPVPDYAKRKPPGVAPARAVESAYQADHGKTRNYKEAIRTNLHHIREHLEKADISDAKRAALKRKLDEFDAALEKNRFNYLAAGRVAMEILSLTANVLSVTESGTVHRLLTNMMQTVAEAKADDDEKRNLPSPNPPAVMLPAKREEPKIVIGPCEDVRADLDDEIPF